MDRNHKDSQFKGKGRLFHFKKRHLLVWTLCHLGYQLCKWSLWIALGMEILGWRACQSYYQCITSLCWDWEVALRQCLCWNFQRWDFAVLFAFSAHYVSPLESTNFLSLRIHINSLLELIIFVFVFRRWLFTHFAWFEENKKLQSCQVELNQYFIESNSQIFIGCLCPKPPFRALGVSLL